MASKPLIFPLIILALTLHSSVLSLPQHKDGARRPVIHFTNVVPHKGLPRVIIRIKAWGVKKAIIALSPGESYQLKIDIDREYHAKAQFGFKFTSTFLVYDPARDRGRAAIYWRADNGGFDYSYNNKSNWKLGAGWESE